MNTRTVTPSDVTLPLDKFPHIEFSVTPATVTEHRCIMCGATDLPKRAKTCSANCRKKASRRKEALQREVDNVNYALLRLVRKSERWPDLKAEVEKALNDCVTLATVTYFETTAKA